MASAIEKWVAQSLGDSIGGLSVGRLQLEKLKSALRYARAKSAFYGKRLRGIEVDAIRALSHLQELPFTTGLNVAQDAMELLCVSQADVERVATVYTSGTTGAAKRVYFTRRDLERTVNFFSAGMVDVLSGADSCLIFMSGQTEHSVARLLQTGLGRIGVRTGIHGPVRDARDACRAAGGFGCLVGLPGEMLYLCRSFPWLRPKSVLLSADYIPASVVAAIEELWRCPVYSHYGMTETCYGLAVQCGARKGMHIRSGEFLVEIVDPLSGVQLPPGQPGEIVLTTLETEALPLVRYKTGDVGIMAQPPGGGADGLPALAKVCGRLDNLRQAVNIHMLDEAVFSIESVRNYSARRVENRIHLLVDVVHGAEGPDPVALGDRIGLEVVVSHAPLGAYTGGKRQIAQSAPEKNALSDTD